MQGSVLGPVLFSLFINDLPPSLPSSVSCFLYADSLAIWSSSSSVPTTVETTQGALIRLERWSEYWCLPLNPRKCETFFFLVDPHQANLRPNLLILSFRLRFNSTPTFLEVTFDRTLSFSKHVFLLKAKFFPRLKALCCISAFAWAILHALCWSRQHQQVGHFSSLLPLSDSRSVLATLSCSPSFLLSQTRWQIRQELSSLSSCSIRLQWVPGHSFLPGNDAADELARRGALLAFSSIPCSFSPLISRIPLLSFLGPEAYCFI